MGTPRYGMDHIHYRATDAQAAAAWWVRVLGAVETGRQTTPAGSLRIVLALAGQTIFVEAAAGDAPTQPAMPHRGLEHIGLTVDDMDAAVADITARGGVLARAVSSPRPGIRICFVAAPEGAEVELVERR